MLFWGKKKDEEETEEIDELQKDKYDEYERKIKEKKQQRKAENEKQMKQEQIKEMKVVEEISKSNVPLLILDKNWHYMFPAGKKTKKMLALEKQLTELLKEQGKLTNNINDYKKLKKDCINQIMGLMGSEDDEDDVQRSKKYIQQSNQKLEQIEQRLEDIPREMKRLNQELLEESIRVVYEEMQENKLKEKLLEQEIKELEEKLAEKKEEKELKKQMIDRTYKFLHSIAGTEALNKWDRKYK